MGLGDLPWEGAPKPLKQFLPARQDAMVAVGEGGRPEGVVGTSFSCRVPNPHPAFGGACVDTSGVPAAGGRFSVLRKNAGWKLQAGVAHWKSPGSQNHLSSLA